MDSWSHPDILIPDLDILLFNFIWIYKDGIIGANGKPKKKAQSIFLPEVFPFDQNFGHFRNQEVSKP